ncbi:hypothetical protein PVAND_010445 [Polypedilum vanderplanki]|uniref:Ankyrin repeat domain-containing protein n=1 Tax=Polypedilum vanderplanki TaxID=319348 RepID=A0A9J6CGQ6_POLVA|nr:hypothetical protein PVAND_010445 [Polypedilum vanderplanki]
MLVSEIKKKYPLHYLVWNNDYQELENLLKENKHDIEALDPRKRTPLMLAVVLSHLQSVKVLLAAKANTFVETDGWTVSQEAVAAKDLDILTSIISFRDLWRQKNRSIQVPELLMKLKNTPDFYVEMNWQFSSWIPLMAKVCPSDTYKVFKRGSFVRIDTTLIGFDQTSWQRGNRSYLFKGLNDEAQFYEIDHDSKEYSVEIMRDIDVELFSNGIPPSSGSLQMRLQTPIISNSIDIEKISFERNKSGWFAWKSEKNETVNGYDCRVYNASNVEFITRTRTEHLTDNQSRSRNARTPLQHFLGLAEDDYDHSSPGQNSPTPSNEAAGPSTPIEKSTQDTSVTIEEYFSDIDLNGRDVGKPKKVTTKVQRFKANLWLSDDFPIKLQEQILPILDLMSTLASPHVSKLKDFITLQLPSGFPVKIEIPLFHVLNALITFGNVFGLENPVQYVTNIKEDDDKRLTCIIDDSCFEVPTNYNNRAIDYSHQGLGFEDEDQLLEFAIRQSLIEAGSENEEVDIWEALKCQRPVTPNYPSGFYPVDEETRELQRALQESFLYSCATRSSPDDEEDNSRSESIDENLELALRLSRAEKLKENELIMEENRMIELAIKMSLMTDES